MQIDDSLGDRQSQASRGLPAGRLRREPLKPTKQAPYVFRRKARPAIGNADDRVALFLPKTYGDLALERAIFDGVADDVVERLTQPSDEARVDGERVHRSPRAAERGDQVETGVLVERRQ